jgi:hypothetical protein
MQNQTQNLLVVGPGGVPRRSNFNVLKLQTSISARIEPKGYFGAITNLKAAATSPAHYASGSRIVPDFEAGAVS